MSEAQERKAREKVRVAQARYERELGKAQEARREAFTEAQRSGLSLRVIGEEVELHHTRIGQIIRGE